jgi:sugar phosphate isomerase/epimerase
VIHPLTASFPAHLDVNELKKYQQQLGWSFTRLVAYAGQKGIKLACENLTNKYGTGVLLYLLEHVPELGMCFDTGHAQLMSACNIFLPHYTKRIVALHLQDTRGRYDEHLIPGDGQIDFTGFIRILMDSGYTGVWGCESVYSALRDENKTALELATKIYSRLLRFVQSAVENRG